MESYRVCDDRISRYFGHILIAERQTVIDVKLFVKVPQFGRLTLH